VKILALSNLYPPDFIGGYELGCRQVVDALRGRGHDVRVLTSIPRAPVPSVPHVVRALQFTEAYPGYFLDQSAAVPCPLPEVGPNFVNAANVYSLTTVLETFRPDVAYVWNVLGLGGLGLLGCLQHLGIPWVGHLMDCVPPLLCASGGRVVRPLAHELGRQLRGHFLACSRRLVEEIAAHGISLDGRVEVVPNWVDGPCPPGRTRYLQGGRLRIVSTGQIAVHKGVDRIIAAAGQLRDRGYDNFAVDLYGRAGDPYFQGLIHRQRLEGHVALQGLRTQAELARLYDDYDLFAFPTWEREPFGFAPLEAAASGCVPVLAQNCGIAEWLVHGVHCIKAERSPEAFAQVFQDALDGRIDLAVLGRRVRAVVRRDFHLDALLPRIEAALARAAREPRGRAGTAAEAYRLALLAEKLTGVLMQEAPGSPLAA
jgi:glycosyltransferase involved in cell wall biosynthesis